MYFLSLIFINVQNENLWNIWSNKNHHIIWKRVVAYINHTAKELLIVKRRPASYVPKYINKLLGKIILIKKDIIPYINIFGEDHSVIKIPDFIIKYKNKNIDYYINI